MNSFSFSSLRVRLVILILIAVVPALAVLLYSAAEQERLDAALVQQNLSRLAVLHVREERQLLDGTRQILRALAQFVVMHREDRKARTAFFANLVKEFGRYTDFGEITLDGRLICTTDPTPAPLNEDDRRWFQQAVQSGELASSGFRVGTVAGRPTLILAYPVIDATGRTLAAVFAGLDLGWLNRLDLLKGERLPAGSHRVAGGGVRKTDRNPMPSPGEP